MEDVMDEKKDRKFDFDSFDIQESDLPTSAAGRKSNYDILTERVVDKVRTLPEDKNSVTVVPPGKSELTNADVNTIINGLRNNLKKRGLDNEIVITRRGGGIYAAPADRIKRK